MVELAWIDLHIAANVLFPYFNGLLPWTYASNIGSHSSPIVFPNLDVSVNIENL